jgi:hypothetical protein
LFIDLDSKEVKKYEFRVELLSKTLSLIHLNLIEDKF